MKRTTKKPRRRKPAPVAVPVELRVGDCVYHLTPRDGRIVWEGKDAAVVVDNGTAADPRRRILLNQFTSDGWLGWAVAKAIEHGTRDTIGTDKAPAYCGAHYVH